MPVAVCVKTIYRVDVTWECVFLEKSEVGDKEVFFARARGLED